MTVSKRKSFVSLVLISDVNENKNPMSSRNQKASQRPLDYEMKRIENVKDLKDK
jgi:hypothetical protein